MRAAVVTAIPTLFWIAPVFAVMGRALMAGTIVDFTRAGKGTLAPWDAPKSSLPVAARLLAFVAVNAIYIPLQEKRGPVRRSDWVGLLRNS